MKKIKTTLIRYYRFLGVLTASISLIVWVLEGKVLKSWDGKINSINEFKTNLMFLHEFWTLKQQMVQQSIDAGRAYKRLGQLLGGSDGLQKYDEEIGRFLVVNTIKTDAMMAAINITELSNKVESVIGKQPKLDSLVKETTRKYNKYAEEINKISLEIKDLKNVSKMEIEKIDSIKSINVHYRDEYVGANLAIMNEAEEVKDKLEDKKKSIEFWSTMINWIVGILIGFMSAATILGSYFEASKNKSAV